MITKKLDKLENKLEQTNRESLLLLFKLLLSCKWINALLVTSANWESKIRMTIRWHPTTEAPFLPAPSLYQLASTLLCPETRPSVFYHYLCFGQTVGHLEDCTVYAQRNRHWAGYHQHTNGITADSACSSSLID